MPYGLSDEEYKKRWEAYNALTDNAMKSRAKRWLIGDVTGTELHGKPGDWGPYPVLWEGGQFVWNPAYIEYNRKNLPSRGGNNAPGQGVDVGSAQSGASGSGGIGSQGGVTMSNQSNIQAGSSGLLNSAFEIKGPYTRDVTPDELASIQLSKLLSKDSPLAQRAYTEGMQYANRRGLLNSSLAAESAFGAWVDRASPIAESDASKYTNVADQNLAYKNQFAAQGNEFAFKSRENELDRALTRSENAANRQHEVNLAQMDMDRDLMLFKMESAWKSSEADKEREFAAQQDEITRRFQAEQNEIARRFQSEEAQKEREFDRESALERMQFEAEVRAREIAQQHEYNLEELGVRFEYDKELIPSQYAAQIMSNTYNSISSVLASDLKPEAKDAAIRNIVTLTNDALKYGETLYGTDLPEFGSAA